MLVNCHIIPCDGQTREIQDGAIVLHDGRIQAVGRRHELASLERDRPAGQVRDMGGRWVMPGLANMHVHLGLALPGPTGLAAKLENDMELTIRCYRNALDALHAGITMIRTVGDKKYVDLTLKKAINTGQLTGPRLFCAGQAVIITGGHGFGGNSCVEADGADGFRAAARAQLRAGADLVKLCITGGIAGEHEAIADSQATFEEMQAAAEAAHNAGKHITAHAGSSKAIITGIKAGLDCIEHGYFIKEETVEVMVRHNIWLVPTLSVSRAPEYMRDLGCPEWMIDKSLKAGEEHMAGYQLALAGGVRMALGTDMLPTDPYLDTLATYREIEWMVDGGMSTEKALLASTLNGAMLMGVEDRLGSVTPGKFADLIAMPASPLADIRALRGIDFVMKDGAVVRD
jgi:imidazolonepropionase-like amidohydrolase